MKRTVTITIEIESRDYLDAVDSNEGAIKVVEEILKGRADLPENGFTKIRCGAKTKVLTW